MKRPPSDIASIRKEQIIEAALAVIAEQGLHHLSLSEIENKAGMSRGQLTYYFKAKEDILLGVFDRVLQLMYQRLGQPPGTGADNGCQPSGWEVTRYLLETLLTRPPLSPEFHCLQYTLLSEISHREDYRQRLAALYEEWRTNMSAGLTADLARRPRGRRVSPRALATLIQALLHGLTMQAAADPNAFDGREMARLCLDVLGTYLGVDAPADAPRKATPKARAASTGGKRRSNNGTPLAPER
jgi:AcrR family transcriptional regulator